MFFFPPSLQEKNFTFKHFPGFRSLYSHLTQQNTLAVTQSRWKNFEKLDDRAKKSLFPLAEKWKSFFYIQPVSLLWPVRFMLLLCDRPELSPEWNWRQCFSRSPFTSHRSTVLLESVLLTHRRCGCVRETFFVLILQLSNWFWNTDTNFASKF